MIKTDVIIIGTGSIALKHASIIKEFYPDLDITLYNYRKRVFYKQKKIDKKILSLFSNITDDHSLILPYTNKSFAIIASPPSYHLEHASLFAKKKFHILCEKPLTDKKGQLKNLIKLLNQNNLSSHVGYNMRFLESINFLKKIIDKKIFGRILSSNIAVHTNFTTWRPNKLYTKTSTAIRSLGGGVVNELSHEIDYMNHIFGCPVAQQSVVHKRKKICIDVHDTCNARFLYPEFKVDVSLDMLSSTEKRTCYIIFEKANILLNFKTNIMHIFKSKREESVYTFAKGMADTYIDQIEYFVKKIKYKKINETDISSYSVLTKSLLKINNTSND